MAYNVVGKIGGRAHVAAMFGWLGDPAKITYRSLGSIAHEWTHGFGVYMLEDDGTIHLEPCPIITRQTDAGKIRTV
jgi:hypothetical protein